MRSHGRGFLRDVIVAASGVDATEVRDVFRMFPLRPASFPSTLDDTLLRLKEREDFSMQYFFPNGLVGRPIFLLPHA